MSIQTYNNSLLKELARKEFLEEEKKFGVLHADLLRLIHDYSITVGRTQSSLAKEFNASFLYVKGWLDNKVSPSLTKIDHFINTTQSNYRFAVESIDRGTYLIKDREEVLNIIMSKKEKALYLVNQDINMGVLHADFVEIVRSYQDDLNSLLDATETNPVVSYETFCLRMRTNRSLFAKWMCGVRVPTLYDVSLFSETNMVPMGFDIRLVIDSPDFEFIPRSKAVLPERGCKMLQFVKKQTQ